jgi:predicted transcriptional regulator
MRNQDQLQISAQYKPWSDSVEIFIHTENAYCSHIEMKTEENLGAIYLTPSCEIKYDMAQRLLEQLWNIGLRPKNNKYGDEVVKTMNDHLQDMRRIAFKFLKMEEKK